MGNNVESHQVEYEVFMKIDDFFMNLIEFLQNSSVFRLILSSAARNFFSGGAKLAI